MKKLTWWFRIVGVFYLLLTAMNIWVLFFSDGQMMADQLPAPMDTDPLAIKAFLDAWLVFVFEFGVLGVFALVASRAPLQHRIMVWVIVFAELFRGVLADAIWITRGYDAAGYIGFIVIHLIIIVTGIVFLRQAQREGETAAVTPSSGRR